MITIMVLLFVVVIQVLANILKMTELKNLAEETKKQLKLKYDSDSVKYLEGFIERTKVNIEKENWSGLINSCGAFLGECIIENYGGIWKDDKNRNIGISFDDKILLILLPKLVSNLRMDLEILSFRFIV